MLNIQLDSLDEEILPKYANYYVSYRQLSEAIDLLRAREAGADSSTALLKGLMLPKDFTFGDTTALYTMVEQKPEVRFGSLLEHELSKINHFTLLEVKTILSNLRIVEKRLTRVNPPKSPDFRTTRSHLFPSMVEDTSSPLADQVESIQSRLASLTDEVIALDQYVRVNTKIFDKVVSSFDTAFNDSSSVGSVFLAKLSYEPFMNIPVNSLLTIISVLVKKLKTIRGSVETTASNGLSAHIVPKSSLARVKLSLALHCPVRLAAIGQLPTRSEELTQKWLSPVSHWVEIVFPGVNSGIHRISFRSDTNRSPEIFVFPTNDPSTPSTTLEKVLPLLPAHVAYKQVTYDRIDFENCASVVENVSVESFDRFDVNSFHDQFPHFETHDVEEGGMVWLPDGGRSIGVQDWISRPCQRGDSVLEILNQRDTLGEQAKTRSTERERRFSVPTLPTPSRGPSPAPPMKANPPAECVMIYPKNFMANERSCLAWLSACSVQAGVGIALLGKPNLSVFGGIICIASIAFLWWAVYLFVQRFRHLRNPDTGNDRVFYSMQLPTMFGTTQIVILVIQGMLVLFV
jgi:hypothetical protein